MRGGWGAWCQPPPSPAPLLPGEPSGSTEPSLKSTTSTSPVGGNRSSERLGDQSRRAEQACERASSEAHPSEASFLRCSLGQLSGGYVAVHGHGNDFLSLLVPRQTRRGVSDAGNGGLHATPSKTSPRPLFPLPRVCVRQMCSRDRTRCCLVLCGSFWVVFGVARVKRCSSGQSENFHRQSGVPRGHLESGGSCPVGDRGPRISS